MTTVTVSGNITAPDGQALPDGAIIRFQLKGTINTVTGFVVPAQVDAAIDGSGDFTVSLAPNNGQDTGTFYIATVIATATGPIIQRLGTYVVPAGGPHTLADLVATAPTIAQGNVVGLAGDLADIRQDITDLEGADATTDVTNVLSSAGLQATGNLADSTTVVGFVGGVLGRFTLGSIRNRIFAVLTSLLNKTTPVNNDSIVMVDSEDGSSGKRVRLSNFLNGWLRPTLDNIYAGEAVETAVTFTGGGLAGRSAGNGLVQQLSNADTRQLLGLGARDHLRSPDPDRQYIEVDRAANVIRFPNMAVQRINRPGVVVGPQTDEFFTELEFPTAAGQWRVYYADLSSSPRQMRVSTDAAFEPTEDNVVIGWAEAGAFISAHDLPVLDTAPPAPIRVDMASNGEVGADALREINARLNLDDGRFGDTRVFVSGDVPIALGFHTDRSVWQFSGTQGAADLTWMPDNTEVVIGCNAQGLVIEAGDGLDFFGQSGANQATLGANAVVRVSNVFDRRLIETINGSVIYGTATYAARNLSIATAGQSPMEYGFEYGWPSAFERALRDNGWMDTVPATQSFYWIEGATGGSSLTQGSNRWLNGSADDAALTAFKSAVTAAVAAGQPAPEAIFWSQGEADAGFMNNGTITLSSQTNALQTIWGRIRDHCISEGATDPQIICIDTGANDATGRQGMTHVRWALQRAIDAVSYAHFGAAAHDVARAPGDIHDTRLGYTTVAYRMARAYTNVINGATEDISPAPVSAALQDGNNRRAVLTLPAGLKLPQGDISATEARGPYPFGLCLLPPNSTGSQAFIDITMAEIISDTEVLIYAKQSLASARVGTVAGWAPEIIAGRHFRTDDIHPGALGLPLRPWVSEPLA